MSFDPEPYPPYITAIIVTALVMAPWALIWWVLK